MNGFVKFYILVHLVNVLRRFISLSALPVWNLSEISTARRRRRRFVFEHFVWCFTVFIFKEVDLVLDFNALLDRQILNICYLFIAPMVFIWWLSLLLFYLQHEAVNWCVNEEEQSSSSLLKASPYRRCWSLA